MNVRDVFFFIVVVIELSFPTGRQVDIESDRPPVRHFTCGEHGLQSPISQKWAGFAKLLSQGLSALPHGALEALVIGVVLGIIFTIFEGTKWKTWTPSPTGVGIGMLVPGSAIVTMFIGGILAEIWKMASPKNAERHLTPVASGFIAGEAIVAVVIPILVTIGLVKLQ